MLCKQGLYCVGLVRLNCDVFWVDKNGVDYFVSVGAVIEGIYLENLETKTTLFLPFILKITQLQGNDMLTACNV